MPGPSPPCVPATKPEELSSGVPRQIAADRRMSRCIGPLDGLRIAPVRGLLSDERGPGHQIERADFQYRDPGRRRVALKHRFGAPRELELEPECREQCVGPVVGGGLVDPGCRSGLSIRAVDPDRDIPPGAAPAVAHDGDVADIAPDVSRIGSDRGGYGRRPRSRSRRSAPRRNGCPASESGPRHHDKSQERRPESRIADPMPACLPRALCPLSSVAMQTGLHERPTPCRAARRAIDEPNGPDVVERKAARRHRRHPSSCNSPRRATTSSRSSPDWGRAIRGGLRCRIRVSDSRHCKIQLAPGGRAPT